MLFLLLALAAVVIFAVQNNDMVTLPYIDRSVTCTLSLFVAIVYVAGMVSGWMVIGWLRRFLLRATEQRRDDSP